MNLAYPWRVSGHVLTDARHQELGAIDDLEVAQFIALAVNHHGDLRGALNYVVQRAAGCVSDDDFRRLVPCIVDCARLSLQRLAAGRPIFTDNIQMDSNVLDDLIASLKYMTDAAERAGDIDAAERGRLALLRVNE
jgi:hypothetical protein